VPVRLSAIRKKVGARLRAIRTSRSPKMSQEALAHAAGLERAYVSGVERGEFNISVDTLTRLARVLHVHIGEFFDFD
jgi:transcriptional regulator with XRE-family HTH domain